MAFGRTLELDEQITKLREALDAAIDARAEEEAKRAPGVPLLVIRNCLTARSGDCQCRAWLQITAKDTA
jgi:hypothetical protein